MLAADDDDDHFVILKFQAGNKIIARKVNSHARYNGFKYDYNIEIYIVL